MHDAKRTPSPFQRVVQGFGWAAAAGLLALLVSTNCAYPGAVAGLISCSGGGGGSTACPRGTTCESSSGRDRCMPVLCSEADCPIGTTCVPPKGRGECKPPDQVACSFTGAPNPLACTAGMCPTGQVCRTISVNAGGPISQATCGCVPNP